MKTKTRSLLALLLAGLMLLCGTAGAAAEAASTLKDAVDETLQSVGEAASEFGQSLGLFFQDAVDSVVGTVKEAFSEADLYFENGIIYTADSHDSLVEALAVKDGVIIFAGTAEEGQALRKSSAQIVDLGGRMLMPGLIDGHLHSVSPSFFDFSLVGLTSLEDTLQTISDHVQANPQAQTYFGFGYLSNVFPGEEATQGPKKERLDEICPDKPMVIYSFDGHAAWLNSKALAYCGIGKDTQSTPGGEIVRDEKGELWGTLRDTAMSFTASVPLDEAKLPAALKAFVSDLNKKGYTSIMSPPGNGFFPLPWKAYGQMLANNELSLRVRGAGLVTSWQTAKDLAALTKLKETYQDDFLKVIAAKIFVDGVADNGSAYLLEPYSDHPDSYGQTGWAQEELNRAFTSVNSLGLLAHLHAMGDAAVNMSLDAAAYAKEQLGSGDYRNAFTHLQLVAPDAFARFGNLNIIAVANPYWHYKAPYYWENVESKAMGERAEHEYPMKSFLDHGVTLVFASDYPVTPDPNPFVAIEMGVTRNLAVDHEFGTPQLEDMDDPRFLLWPQERLTILQMLRGYTIDAAYAIFAETVTGSLEVGKAADMIVLDQNLLAIDPLEIHKTQVLATFFHGELVYLAEEAR